MPLTDRLTDLFQRYGCAGEPVRFAFRQMLPWLFPGSGPLVAFIDDALGTAQAMWRDRQHVDLQQATAAQGEQLAQLEQIVQVVSYDLGGLFDQVARREAQSHGAEQALALIEQYRQRQASQWQQAHVKLDQMGRVLTDMLAQLNAGLLDIQAEIQRLQQEDSDRYGKQMALMRQVLQGVESLQAGQGMATPTLTQVIVDPVKRQLVRDLLKQIDALPATDRARLPATLNGLGKLALGVGELEAAEAKFDEASTYVTRDGDRAEAQYNAYQVALEREDWRAAKAHIEQAIRLDPVRFEPYPLYKYGLEAILGAGGFGVVFRGTHHLLQKPLVIKCLHTHGLDRPIEVVLREAHALIGLRHPAVIELIDVDDRPKPHLIMEYFEGESLERYLQREGPLAFGDFWPLATTLANAMVAVHGQGILHRDIKPQNVLVRRDGEQWACRIIDFGLALNTQALRQQTHQRSQWGSSIGGTLAYAPPEQLGEMVGVSVGPHSDLYSFGALCCRLLTGRPKPQGRDWRGKHVPEAIVDLLENCLADPIEERPKSFDEVLATLGRHGTPRPTPPSRTTVEASPRPPPAPAPAPSLETDPKPLEIPVSIQTPSPPAPGPSASIPPHPASVPSASDIVDGGSVEAMQARQRQTALGLGFAEVIFHDQPEGPPMAIIPPGTFTMGSRHRGDGDNRPHGVQISQPLAVGVYTLTFAEYDRFCNATGQRPPEDQGWGRGQRPVIGISWDDAKAYARWLGEQTGRPYRLLTEAEWEYACRAGAWRPYWWGNGISFERACYGGMDPAQSRHTLPVDAFSPNPWGLYQMHGNVWEWCEDVYRKDISVGDVQVDPLYDVGSSWRVCRGGGWYSAAGDLRASRRYSWSPTGRRTSLGMRLARVLEPEL
ncbi:MAG: SUMF1/EgtB/PvdO family nonheme iron enzyme [Candidatus Competibacterales bacterium]